MRGVAVIAALILTGCGVAPYGAQVYLVRVQQNYADITQSCAAGDQVACGLRPFAVKAVAQAQEQVDQPWR